MPAKVIPRNVSEFSPIHLSHKYLPLIRINGCPLSPAALHDNKTDIFSILLPKIVLVDATPFAPTHLVFDEERQKDVLSRFHILFGLFSK